MTLRNLGESYSALAALAGEQVADLLGIAKLEAVQAVVVSVRSKNQSGQATKGVWGMSWCQEA